MIPPRHLTIVPFEQLLQLTEARLLAYRKKALSLENCPEDSDYSLKEVSVLDQKYIWFKSDPRWRIVYDEILAALARVQSHHKQGSSQ